MSKQQKVALITGITGQDGSYLAEFLLERQNVFDASKLDGSSQKWMSSKQLNQLGWSPKIDLPTGLSNAYRDFQQLFV